MPDLAGATKATVQSAFDTYMTELKQAGPHWDKKPAVKADGEDAWSARQVAEHMADASPFYAAAVAKAIGITPPQLGRHTFPAASDSIAATEAAHRVLIDVIDQLSDSQLAIETENRVTGKITVNGLVLACSSHVREHTKQLQALREG